MVCTRTRAEVSRSEAECFYVLYVLSGYHACEQNGRRNSAGPGEIIVVDSGQPCRVENGSPPYDVICITVPKADLNGIRDLEDKLANLLVTRVPTAAPLFSCANLISRQLNYSSQQELTVLYDACVALLPIAGGCFDDEHKEKSGTARDRLLLRELQEFVDRHTADPELTPGKAADHFGISVRYVHKLFAELGTTFNAYVSASRLDNVRADILCPSWDDRKISELAFRWGFSDLSTFNRSFKQRFGCAPSRYRTRGE
jgi:AraC-like DNA-binding protein